MIGEVIEPKSTCRFSETDSVCREVLIQVDWTPLWLWGESSRSMIQELQWEKRGGDGEVRKAKPKRFVWGRSINLRPVFVCFTGKMDVLCWLGSAFSSSWLWLPQ